MLADWTSRAAEAIMRHVPTQHVPGLRKLSSDPELRRLYLDAQKAGERLVARLESYGQLVPGRAEEAAVADDVARFARFVERTFRGWYERSRNMRESLEDPDLRMPPRSTSEPDPRDD